MIVSMHQPSPATAPGPVGLSVVTGVFVGESLHGGAADLLPGQVGWPGPAARRLRMSQARDSLGFRLCQCYVIRIH